MTRFESVPSRPESVDVNLNVYDRDEVVRFHARERDLHKPERAVLQLLRGLLNGMRMLDIGVGGGRTTIHFGPLVKDYIGIDYSSNMIEGCRREFRDAGIPYSFEVCDARDLRRFDDGLFDLILFSFNGIDSMGHEDRLKCLREIRRVGRRGGYFCFASHNLGAAMKPFSLRRTRSLLRVPTWMLRRIAFIILNREALHRIREDDHAILRDAGQRFQLWEYYIWPEAQVSQLQELGFHDVRLFGREGEEIPSPSDRASSLPDSWIYYLCTI
jgi:ubiquinone/menaquinone biosynthesis C-methylase UbiE